MSRILIVYGTTEGHTHKIAEYMAERIRRNGHQADVTDCDSSPHPTTAIEFDGYILGGSIHEGHHQQALAHFVKENLGDLQHAPTAFFSVSLTAAVKDEQHLKDAQAYIDHFLEETEWAPDMTVPVAGALLYTQYSFLKRFLMKMIAKHTGGETDTSRDYEYTDWNEIDRFVDDFLEKHVVPAAKSVEA
jgi:menaquinone-dependent protoporphyrinogen oxidase